MTFLSKLIMPDCNVTALMVCFFSSHPAYNTSDASDSPTRFVRHIFIQDYLGNFTEKLKLMWHQVYIYVLSPHVRILNELNSLDDTWVNKLIRFSFLIEFFLYFYTSTI